MKSQRPEIRRPEIGRPNLDSLWRGLADAQDAALSSAPPAPVTLRPSDARQPMRRVRPSVTVLGFAAAAAAITLAVCASIVASRGRALELQVAGTGERVVAGRTLVADARSDLPLHFSDGSRITFRAGAAGRIDRTTDRGADVVLDQGSLEAEVVHAKRTAWRVHAGPYTVRVTGTRFITRWSGGRFGLTLLEGSVVIEGALLAAGLPVTAPQELTIEAGVVRTQPLGGIAAAPPPSAAQDERPAPAGAPAEVSSFSAPGGARPEPRPQRDDWFGLATRGLYGDAFRAAERVGWTTLVAELDPRQLLMLGDVGRYAHADGRARQAFQALVTRFPNDALAPDAVFSLGRLAYEAHDAGRAARWFQRYVARWPDGPLADQAAGRLLECAVRLDDQGAARRAAGAYLARAPLGPHAALAKSVLHETGDSEVAGATSAPASERAR